MHDPPLVQPQSHQDNVFWEGEGDAWFRRCRDGLAAPGQVARDPALQMLEHYRLQPRRVLEVGCSNGWRLAGIEERWACACVGVDPSCEALEAGRAACPGLDLRRGVAAQLPIARDEVFDLVIVSFVFCWVDRWALLASAAEVDRCIAEGGFLLLADFWPDASVANPYHHRQDVDVRTFKQDYGGLFEGTGLYKTIAKMSYHHAGEPDANASSYDRAVCHLLRKSLTGFYAG